MIALLGVSLLPPALFAADVTGAWTLELTPDFGGRNQVGIPCTLKQQDEKLTVLCGEPNDQYPPQPMAGTVVGQKVTFDIKTGDKGQLTATFSGALDRPETTITGTWQLADNRGKREGKFALRKE